MGRQKISPKENLTDIKSIFFKGRMPHQPLSKSVKTPKGLAVSLHNKEAQLLQRDRATLCVTEYFTKLFKVIQNDTLEKSLLEFRCNYLCIS